MDLAAGARRVVVLQSHTSKDGNPKLVSRLTLPATALGCANRVITELGVFDTAGDCFICVVRAADVRQDIIERSTGARVLFTTVTASR
jgi:3-oxoacid CoA-transferase subunit B